MLRCEQVRTGYGRSEVVHGVDLEVAHGEVVAVLGHNGAGKSTLLRCTMGLLPAMSGRISVGGRDLTRARPHQRVRAGIAYVPQGQQSFGDLTARENLQVVADRVPDGARRIEEAVALFPAIGGLMERRAGLLSGGQRQQLAIARALVTAPQLLVLDEPTEGIQPSVVAEIEEAVVRLAREDGLAVLLVEQHVGFALEACDRYAVMQSGEIAASGTGGVQATAEVRSAMTI